MASNLGASRLAGLARGIELETPAIELARRALPRLEQTIGETLAELRAIA